MRNGEKGFTLIEMLVVMAIIATLMTLVAPRFFKQTEYAKEIVLRHNQHAIRAAIAAWRHDHLTGPEQLQELVDKGYLFDIPVDPVTKRRDNWEIITDEEGQIKDVKSPSLPASGDEQAQ